MSIWRVAAVIAFVCAGLTVPNSSEARSSRSSLGAGSYCGRSGCYDRDPSSGFHRKPKEHYFGSGGRSRSRY